MIPDVRLIDANALIKKIEGTHCKGCNNYNGVMCRACEWMDAMDYIEDAPTVDAQLVKHGEWIVPKNDDEQPYCSVCNWHAYGDLFTDYCPGCGAYMVGD